MESRKKQVTRWVVAGAMVAVGIAHFAAPSGFVQIVPSWLPAPLLLVWISGACEIAGGLGLVIPRVQRLAAYGLVALYVAVFPANINMAVNHIRLGGLPDAALWLRLPFQGVFIAIALWLAKPPSLPTPAAP